MKKAQNKRSGRLRITEVNSVIAYAASLMLTGVPPLVCESVITGFFCSVRRSIDTLIP
jgi:hypothetical protein